MVPILKMGNRELGIGNWEDARGLANASLSGRRIVKARTGQLKPSSSTATLDVTHSKPFGRVSIV